MKITAMALLCLLALLLQTTVFSALPLRGSYPDLVTVLVVNLGILNGSYEGAGLGFVAGLLADLLVGRFIGINGVALGLVGFISGAAAKRLYRDNYVVPFFFTIVGTWVGRVLVLLGMALFGETVQWNLHLVRYIGLSGLYSALITVLIYRRFVKLNERIIYWDELVRRTG
ncbi:MAG TPA: rod shape-determining protein MreD [Firmicutes bacterium]|nr:rod shape-determining protein MreD [Bacillota bacterium]